ncbi:MAG: metallophosphoesterase, partial [Clostridia bacterium]|nr:metallophosphoesterase [Clostridia bacterium]
MNIEHTKGRLLVTSDIHGHIEHLKAVLQKARFDGDDLLLIVGDMLDKGPKSLETLRYVMKLCAEGRALVTMGNVDYLRLTSIKYTIDNPENAQNFLDYINYMNEWKKSSVRIGAPTNLLAAVTAFIPVLYLCFTYDCWPETSLILSAWGLTALSFGAFYVVEPISYYAALGLSGTYLGFLSGNIGNMRVPCAALALDVTESESGTLQAEVVSTMAICGS